MIPNKNEKGCTGHEVLCILFIFSQENLSDSLSFLR